MKDIPPDMLRAVSMFLSLSRIEPEAVVAAVMYLRAANEGWTVAEMRDRFDALIDALQVDADALAELPRRSMTGTWPLTCSNGKARPCNDEWCTPRQTWRRTDRRAARALHGRRHGWPISHCRTSSRASAASAASGSRLQSAGAGCAGGATMPQACHRLSRTDKPWKAERESR